MTESVNKVLVVLDELEKLVRVNKAARSLERAARDHRRMHQLETFNETLQDKLDEAEKRADVLETIIDNLQVEAKDGEREKQELRSALEDSEDRSAQLEEDLREERKLRLVAEDSAEDSNRRVVSLEVRLETMRDEIERLRARNQD